MPKSVPEYIVDFLLGFLPSLLPKSVDSAAKSAIESFRGSLDGVLKEPRIQRELLEAAQKAEGEFRRQARIYLKNDDLSQAVASFPLFDRDLFQTTLAELPNHLREEYIAQDLQSFIDNDWKGKFTPEELREGVALYLNCLRVELLKVEGFADVVTRLATLRTDQRTEQILAIVTELSQLVKLLVDRGNVLPQITTTYGLFTIPQPVTDFTGREQELMKLKEHFSRGAIITGVSGAGGIGKTELARKLVHDLADNYPDAQISINLLGTSEKPLLWEEAMRRLLEPLHGQKLPEDKEQLKGLYQHTLGEKKVLLLLDNAANAAQVRPLVPPAPSAAIVTSRQHFSLTEFGLHEPLRLDVLSPNKARELLRSASPKLINASDEEVNELAKLCGYFPLALRVTASVLNDRPDWAASHIIKRLSDERTRLQRLKRKDDMSLDVETSLSLSYILLDDDTRLRFRQLSILSESFDLNEVFALWGKMEIASNEYKHISLNPEIGDAILEKLILSSLVEYNQNLDRYYLHDIIKIYAKGQLSVQELTMGAWCLLDFFTHYESRKNNLEKDTTIYSLSLAKDYFLYLKDIKEALSSVTHVEVHEDSDLAYLRKSGESLVEYLNGVPRNLIIGADSTTSSFEDAMSAYRLALDFSIANHDLDYEALALERIGTLYCKLKDYNNAFDHYKKSIQLAKLNKDVFLAARNFLMMGLACVERVDTEIEPAPLILSAYKYLRKAVNMFDEGKAYDGKIVALLNLRKLLYAVGEDDRCLKILEQLATSDLHPSLITLLRAFVKKEKLDSDSVQYLVDDIHGLHEPKEKKPIQIVPGFYIQPSEKQRPRLVFDRITRRYALTSENGLDPSTNDFIELVSKIVVSGNFPK